MTLSITQSMGTVIARVSLSDDLEPCSLSLSVSWAVTRLDMRRASNIGLTHAGREHMFLGWSKMACAVVIGL